MGGLPSAPIPVTLPNDLDLKPGEKAELWYYDAAPFLGVPGEWRMAGMGTVSEDGARIVSDPGVGINRFCGVCGLSCFITRQQSPDQTPLNPSTPTGADPVNLFLGQLIVEKTDLVLPGRIPAVIHRTYNPFDPFGGIAGFELGLGQGWTLSVDVVLQVETPSLLRPVFPGNARFAFVRQPDGGFTNSTHPLFGGVKLTPQAGSGHVIRAKDGTLSRFAPSGRVAGVELLVEQIDRNGNRLVIERNNSDQITRILEPAGRELQFTYTAGRITEIRDPIGRAVRYGYNSNRRLETVTDPAGGVTRYTYDAAGRILTITDARGIIYLINQYDANGRVIRQTQADGGVWKFEYLRPCKQGEIVKSLILLCDLLSPSEGTPSGTVMTDPRGNTTTYRFSATGFTNEMVDALGQVTRFERDASGQVIAATDPLGRVTRFEYDGAGNVTRSTDPTGNVRRFEYESTFNRLTKLTDPLGHSTTFTYDTRGNLTKVVTPLGNVTQITYDAFGQPVAVIDPLGNESALSYDAQGNLATFTDPLGNTSRRVYDAVSRLIEQINPRENATRFSYDALNRLTQSVDALNGVTKLTYDENGNVQTVTDASNHTTSYQYDAMDRVTRRADPLGANESFEYDPLGNLIRHTDRKQQVSTLSYDPLNRRTGTAYVDSTTNFLYDSAGRLVQASDSIGGDILNAYDVLDRLVQETTDLGAVQYAYDASGRRTAMSVPGQVPVSYDYDADSRPIHISQGNQAVTFSYDALGRRTRLTLPNGVTTEYDYDPASRLTELLYRNTLGVLGNLTYEYDPAGNRTRVGGSFARTLMPDSVGPASYDAGNRQQQFGDRQMTFDANGNQTSIMQPGGPTTFTWDARNRLSALTGPGATASFTYDPFGRRTLKQVNGQPVQYLYDGFDIVQEIASGVPVNSLRSLNIDELLARNGAEYPLADALGSTIALTTATGAVQTENTYEAFGKTTTVGLEANPFQFTGRENDGVTNLYFYRARYYDTKAGRFISEDPIRSQVSSTLYGYTERNPVNLVDPLGLRPRVSRGRGKFPPLIQGHRNPNRIESGDSEPPLIDKFSEAVEWTVELMTDAGELRETFRESVGIKGGLDYETEQERQNRMRFEDFILRDGDRLPFLPIPENMPINESGFSDAYPRLKPFDINNDGFLTDDEFRRYRDYLTMLKQSRKKG